MKSKNNNQKQPENVNVSEIEQKRLREISEYSQTRMGIFNPDFFGSSKKNLALGLLAAATLTAMVTLSGCSAPAKTSSGNPSPSLPTPNVIKEGTYHSQIGIDCNYKYNNTGIVSVSCSCSNVPYCSSNRASDFQKGFAGSFANMKIEDQHFNKVIPEKPFLCIHNNTSMISCLVGSTDSLEYEDIIDGYRAGIDASNQVYGTDVQTKNFSVLKKEGDSFLVYQRNYA